MRHPFDKILCGNKILPTRSRLYPAFSNALHPTFKREEPGLLSLLMTVPLPGFASAQSGPSCQELLNAATATRNIVVEREEDFLHLVSGEAARDKATVARMENEPADFFMELRRKAQASIKAGHDDFAFEPNKPILERIVKDLRIRKTRKFGDKFAPELEQLALKGEKLLADGAPYKATARFIINEYVEALDKILIERHPDLGNNHYHKKHAEHNFETFLATAPDMFLIFSMADIGPQFFTNSRSAPLQLVGLLLSGLDDNLAVRPHADKFDMLVSEFAWHDIGHVEFMAMRDLGYLRAETSKPIERVVYEWDATRVRLLRYIEEIRKTDLDLADTMTELLSELLHERGFQYSLTVLKQELETPKWVGVMMKKWNSGFYAKLSPNPKIFQPARLAKARKLLLQAVNHFKEEDQLNWIRATGAERGVPVQVTFTPKLGYAEGSLQGIEIRDINDISFKCLTAKGRTDHTGIKEMVSAQVNPTSRSPFDRLTRSAIAAVLAMKAQGIRHVEAVMVDRNGAVFVKGSDGALTPLSQIQIPKGLKTEPFALANLSYFEMEQLLGSAERNEPTAYTLRNPQVIYQKRINLFRSQAGGPYYIDFVSDSGEKIRLPLADVRIDPLRN